MQKDTFTSNLINQTYQNMKKLLFFVFILLTGKESFSQWGGQPVINHMPIGELIGGRLPFLIEENINIKGSPFLSDMFSDSCFAQLRNEKVYGGLKLRFNLETNKVHFQDKEKKEFVADNGVIKRFSIKTFDGRDFVEYIFGCGYPESPGITPYTYFQEFNFGSAVFLNLMTKYIVERKTLATVDPQKQYDTKNTYYVYNSNSKKLVKWRKGKEFILDILADKATEVKKYIDENNIDCKSSEDIIRVLQFYNNLFAK